MTSRRPRTSQFPFGGRDSTYQASARLVSVNTCLPPPEKGPHLCTQCLSTAQHPSIPCPLDRSPMFLSLHPAPPLNQQGLKTIEGLDACPELEALWLNDNALERIHGLEGCPRLRRLYLWNNRVRRLQGLGHLAKLEVLWVAGNDIMVVEGLEVGGWGQRDAAALTASFGAAFAKAHREGRAHGLWLAARWDARESSWRAAGLRWGWSSGGWAPVWAWPRCV